jgi:pantetheine-phosphate adenylyltransferase
MKKFQTFVFPGTFDPITNGHLRLIREMLNFIGEKDKLCIGVSNSPLKKPILSFDDRYESTKSSLKKANLLSDRIIVEKIQGNTAEFINKKNAICLRGIRNLEDLIYESYWPISRSSNHPVENFFLLPLLNENSYQISSTFFKNKIDEFIKKNPKISFEKLYSLLKDIAPYDVVKILYQMKTGKEVVKDIDHDEIMIEDINENRKQKNSLLIADYNILDNGYLELMIQAANLSEELIIAIPQFIQHEKIEFSKRLDLTKRIVEKLRNDFNIQNIRIIAYDLIFNNPIDLQNLFEQNNIEQYFLEVREYHTRNKERLENIFNQISFLYKNKIKSMIFLQEKYRDFSQPVILQMGHDSFDRESKKLLLNENRKLTDVLPHDSIVLLEEYLKDFYK